MGRGGGFSVMMHFNGWDEPLNSFHDKLIIMTAFLSGATTMEAQVATERVTTLMTPSEKSSLEGKAKRAGVSVGEFVRRSVDAYNPEEIEAMAQLAMLASDLRKSNDAASAALDQALASIEATRRQLDASQGRSAA
jgi:hypothetical protein